MGATLKNGHRVVCGSLRVEPPPWPWFLGVGGPLQSSDGRGLNMWSTPDQADICSQDGQAIRSHMTTRSGQIRTNRDKIKAPLPRSGNGAFGGQSEYRKYGIVGILAMRGAILAMHRAHCRPF